MRLRLGIGFPGTTVAALAPAGAAAETIGGAHQISAAIPLRIDHHIGFVPAFEPDSVLNHLNVGGGGCSQTTGRWSVVEGWRYEENGGGIIARVAFEFEQANVATVELPGDAPEAGYIDGQPHFRSRSLAGSC